MDYMGSSRIRAFYPGSVEPLGWKGPESLESLAREGGGVRSEKSGDRVAEDPGLRDWGLEFLNRVSSNRVETMRGTRCSASPSLSLRFAGGTWMESRWGNEPGESGLGSVLKYTECSAAKG